MDVPGSVLRGNDQPMDAARPIQYDRCYGRNSVLLRCAVRLAPFSAVPKCSGEAFQDRSKNREGQRGKSMSWRRSCPTVSGHCSRFPSLQCQRDPVFTLIAPWLLLGSWLSVQVSGDWAVDPTVNLYVEAMLSIKMW